MRLSEPNYLCPVLHRQFFMLQTFSDEILREPRFARIPE